jgi:hypothetical protein
MLFYKIKIKIKILFFVSNVIINYCYQVLSISCGHSSSCSRHFVSAFSWKKSLKIPNGGNQNPYIIEEQTT